MSSAVRVKVPPAEIGILTVSQAQALLVACPPEILPAIAIGMFGGLRASEIARLDWSDINLDRGFIEVGASKTKTARRRLVQISENLSTWLAPHRREDGPVRQPFVVYRNRFAKALKAAGIKEWPNNALRHSFASYHLVRSPERGSNGIATRTHRERHSLCSLP